MIPNRRSSAIFRQRRKLRICSVVQELGRAAFDFGQSRAGNINGDENLNCA
jgi:hypothetical protein